MSNKMIEVDTSQLEAFNAKLKKLKKDKIPEFLERCAKALAAEVLSRTVRRTPRDTSQLARGWRAGSVEAEWASQADVERRGKDYIITITNPVDYAVYVEYGHRTPDHRSWVPGHFMLTLSVVEVERMKAALLEDMLKDFLKELLK